MLDIGSTAALATVQSQRWTIFSLLSDHRTDIFENQGTFKSMKSERIFVIEKHAVNENHPTSLELTRATDHSTRGVREPESASEEIDREQEREKRTWEREDRGERDFTFQGDARPIHTLSG
jgi:hypothetical protein